MKLTKDNYHKSKNSLGLLSTSDIKIYKENPSKFKKEIIDGEKEYKSSDALVIGSAVDEWLTESKESFLNKFSPKVKKKDNAELFEKNKEYLETGKKQLLAESKYNQVFDMCTKIEDLDFYKNIVSKCQSQPVFSMPYQLNHGYSGLTGMLDYLLIQGNQALIVDLKTARPFMPRQYRDESLEEYQARCSKVYLYRCYSYGYDMQAGMYCNLIKHNYPNIKNIKFYHLTIEKNAPFYSTHIIEFSQETIDTGWDKVIDLLERIKNDRLFLDKYINPIDSIDFSTIKQSLII